MTRLVRTLPIALALTCIALACSVGQGQGWARGSLLMTDCRIDSPAFDLAPDFFAADFIEEPATLIGLRRRSVTIRVQRGSYQEDTSDGIGIFIRDVTDISTRLGEPIALGDPDQPDATMTLYLGRSCPSGRPNSDYYIIPATIGAVSGTITFDAVYAPNVAGSPLEFAGHFEGVHFESVDTPDERHADLDGAFTFFYQRGRPAQRFP
jgi:hypothetical protein